MLGVFLSGSHPKPAEEKQGALGVHTGGGPRRAPAGPWGLGHSQASETRSGRGGLSTRMRAASPPAPGRTQAQPSHVSSPTQSCGWEAGAPTGRAEPRGRQDAAPPVGAGEVVPAGHRAESTEDGGRRAAAPAPADGTRPSRSLCLGLPSPAARS